MAETVCAPAATATAQLPLRIPASAAPAAAAPAVTHPVETGVLDADEFDAADSESTYGDVSLVNTQTIQADRQLAQGGESDATSLS